MIPNIILKLALIVIIVRNLYLAVNQLNSWSKNWLDVCYRIAIAIIAFSLYTGWFHRFP